ncbi:MAG TPA: HoxN/HupN/NixA family nickel/cobalt transporter [Ktedonobacterales bacterium]|nr:HoxN/HupN/NixA family nickel/cobalt transporter [Ktedonobacterales bacterium]
MLALRRALSDTTPGVRRKVVAVYAALIGVNLILWALTLLAAIQYPIMLAVALPAYGFGLRHAVDADHISAIDNVTRKLMQERKQPVGVGLFFSLGHSTVVIIMAALIALGSVFIRDSLSDGGSSLAVIGGLVGTSVSAVFLLAIAAMNLVILVEVVRTFRQVTRGGAYDGDAIEEYLNRRGFFARIFRGLFKSVDASWKMYPIGFLFGLGFDTATEIGLLAATSGFATQHVPFYVVLLLPLLFTAGMSLADTTDGVMMLGAYGWAFVKPVRKLFYNISITLVSALVATLVGGLELLSIFQGQLNLSGGFWDAIYFLSNGADGRNFGYIGAGIIAIFILSWVVSTVIYRVNRYDEMDQRAQGCDATSGAVALHPRERLD